MYEDAQCEAKGLISTRITVSEQLTDRKQKLEAELAMVNEAIAALASDPKVEQIFNCVSRVIGRF